MPADSEDRDGAAADLARLVRRLRGLSRRGWSPGDVEQKVRALAEALVAIGGEGHRLSDDLPVHALADVVAVVGQDALGGKGAAPAIGALPLDALDATR